MNSRLTYLAYRAGSGLLSILPEPAVRCLGLRAGRLAWRRAGRPGRPGYRREMALRHMRRVLPAAGEDEVERTAEELFAAYGRYWAEVLWFRPRRFAEVRSRMSASGLEHVRAVQAAQRPMIIALPHIGNWEMAAVLADEEGVRITAVAEALADRRLADWFTGMRARLNIGVVLAEGPGTMRKLLSLLREGHTIALVADRNIGGRGIEVEFFGEKTALPAGPAVMALRTGAALLAGASYFQPGAGHRMAVLPPIEAPERGAPDRAAVMTQELAGRFEQLIREAPAQWHLVQPNWPSDREFLAARREGR